jgi:hypothetical protein
MDEDKEDDRERKEQDEDAESYQFSSQYEYLSSIFQEGVVQDDVDVALELLVALCINNNKKQIINKQKCIDTTK